MTKAERDFYEVARKYAAIMEADHRNARNGEAIGKRIQDARNSFFEAYRALLAEEEKVASPLRYDEEPVATPPVAEPKRGVEEIIDEMRRDLVGGTYPDGPGYSGPTATVLWRAWHGPGPGMEGYVSLATVEHVKEYCDRLMRLYREEKRSDHGYIEKLKADRAELDKAALDLEAELAALRASRRRNARRWRRRMAG